MCIAGTSCLYERHKPEETRLHKVVSENWLSFQRAREQEGRTVPKFVVKEFEGYLRCGILAHGFARLHCGQCKVDRLVAFSCKGRGWCPSCGARRMAEVAARLVDSRIPLVPTRQFVVTFPVQLRLWLAKSKPLAAWVCVKVAQCLQAHLRSESGIEEGKTGFVSFVQRFGSAANLNVHLHIIALDGSYDKKSTGRLKFYPSGAPREDSMLRLIHEISQKINSHLIKKCYLEVIEDTPVVGVTDSLFDNTEDLHLPAQAASVAHKIAFGIE
jgi:ribosomal protein S27AE